MFLLSGDFSGKRVKDSSEKPTRLAWLAVDSLTTPGGIGHIEVNVVGRGHALKTQSNNNRLFNLMDTPHL